MPGATDTRIVQMQFDNKDFEKNIKISDESLSKFKQNLDFNKCEKSLSDFGKAVKTLTFDGLVDNVQKLADKFTGLGNISEMVISKIRSGIEAAVSKVTGLVNSLGFEQVSAGLDKFSKMNKNVQTIMAATGKSEEDVMKVMQRLNEYTDQTSYNFTDMASNIGKFTSVGINLEDAEKQMEGIANWAARSGAGIQEASRAMYNLSQAMGVGKLTKIDWKSIENAGMATKEFKEQLIQAGLAAGTLVNEKGVVKTAKSLGKQMEVSYKNVAETLSKGWANTTVLGNTLGKYYYDDLYYENAQEAILNLAEDQKTAFDKIMSENEKLNQSNYKTLASMGIFTDDNKQKILDLAVSQGKLTETTTKEGKKQFEAIDKTGKKVKFTFEEFESSLSAGWFDKGLYDTATSIDSLAKSSYEAAQKCMTLSDVFDAWKDQLSTGWMKAWQKIFGDLSESMELFSTICNKVGDKFSDFIRVLVGGQKEAEDGTIESVKGILGSWAELGGRQSLWSMMVGEYDGMYEGAYGLLDVLSDIGKMISDAFWSMIKTMSPDLDNMSNDEWLANEAYRTEYLGMKIKGAIDKVKGFIQSIKDFLNAVPEGQTKSRFQIIQDVVNGVMNTIGIVSRSIQDIVNFITTLFGQDMLGPVIDDIIGIFSSLGNEITKTASATAKGQGLKAFLDKLIAIFVDSGLIDAIKIFSKEFRNLFDVLIGSGQEGSKTISVWETITKVLSKVASVISRIATPIIKYLGGVIGAFKDLTSGKIDFKQFALNIKASFKVMLDSIFSFTPNFTDKVGGIFKAIKNVFTSGFSKESIDELGERFSVIFGDLKKSIPESLKKTGKGLYGSVKNFVLNLWAKIKNAFSPLFSSIKKIFTSGFSKDSLNEAKDQFKIFFEKIGNKIPDGIKESAKNILKRIQEALTGFWEKVKAKIGGIFGINKGEATDVLDNSQKPVQGAIGTFFTNLKTWFSGFVGDFKGELKNANLFSIIKEWLGIGLLGKFIGGLTGILKGTNMYAIIMSFLGGYSLIKLIKMLKQGSGLFKTMKGFFTNMQDGLKISMDPKTETFGDKMLKIGKALALIVGAIVVLGMIPLNKLLQGGIAFAVILGLISGFLFVLKKAAGDFKQTMTMIGLLAAMAAMIIALTIGVSILITALRPLASMSLEGIAKMMLGFAGILTILYIFAKQVSKQENGIKVKGVMSFVLLAIAIGILVMALRPLADLSIGGLAKMGVGLAGILAMLTLFTKKVSYMKGSGMTSLILVAGSIWILLEALKPLADYSWEQLGKMGVALVALVTMLSIFTNNSASMKSTGMGQLIIVAGAIYILLEALKPLANYEWDQLAKMGAGLVVLVASLIIFTRALDGVKVEGAVGTGAVVGALSGAIYALVQALLPLANYSWEALGKMAAGLVLLVAVVIIMTRLIKPVHSVKEGLGTGAMMLGLVAVVAAFALLFVSIKDVSWESIAAACLGLTAVIVVFMLMIRNMMRIRDISKAAAVLVMFVGLAALMVAFGIALKSIKGVKTETIAAFALGLTALIVGMAAAIKVLSGVNILAGIKSIILISVGLAAVMGVLSLMIPLVMDAIGAGLENMMSHLAIVAGMFSTFMSNMNGVSEGDLDATKRKFEKLMEIIWTLKDMGSYYEAIHSFADCMLLLGSGVSQFVFSTQGIGDVESMGGVKLVEKFLDMKDRLKAFEIGNIANDLFTLGEGISLFVSATSNVTTDEPMALTLLKGLADEADNIEKLTNLPLDTLKSQLAGLGGALSLYASGAAEATGLDLTDEGVPNVSGAVSLLQAITQSLSGEGNGFAIPDIPDESELDTFGADLAALALALVKFGEASSGLTNTETAIELLGFLERLKTRLTTENLASTLAFKTAKVNKTGLEAFGIEIAALGDALCKYDQSVKNFTGSDAAINALDFFVALKDKLLAQTLKQTIFSFADAGIKSKDPLVSFGTEISALGQALAKFANDTNFTGDVESTFNNAILALDKVVEMARRMPKIGGIVGFFEGNTQTLGQLGTDLETVGQALSDMSNKLSGNESNFKKFDYELVSSALKALDGITQIATALASTKAVEGAYDGYRDLTDLAVFISRFTNADYWSGDENLKNGETIIDYFIAMMVQMKEASEKVGGFDNTKPFEAFKNMAEGIAALVNVDPTLDFSIIGENIGKGIIEGLEAQKEDVRNAIMALVSLGEVFKTNGQVDSTITPIMDLTNVDAGQEALKQLFSNPYGLTINDGVMSIDLAKASIFAGEALPKDQTANIERVRTEVANMRGDLRALSEAMRQTKFVFQSGQVVAAIGPEMDAYLAQQGYYAVRGEIP